MTIRIKIRIGSPANTQKDASSSERNTPLNVAVFGAIVVLLVKMVWPSTIPFETFSFWESRGTPAVWLLAGVPLLVWGVLAQTAWELFKRRLGSLRPALQLGLGTLGAFMNGVLEEVAYRWLGFLSAIVGAKILNFLFFGLLGFGIPRWLHMNLLGPIADWATLGHLDARLMNAHEWAVGLAMLMANAAFRNNHRYDNKYFAAVNAWFVGMFLFWVMFTFGLPAAIVLHIAYDALTTLVAAIGSKVRGRYLR